MSAFALISDLHSNLEALDGTPVIDLKPVLPGVPDA